MSQAELLPEVAPVSPFQFQNHPIRTQLEDEILWFVAKDVCDALGIVWKSGKGAGNSGSLASIPAEWQGMRKFLTPSGRQHLKVILEPAVYKLAFRSNKPEADAFTNWIASEVVPSIRKTGRYEATPAPSPISKRSDPERKALTAIINTWVGMAPIHYASARAQVNAHFGVASVDALTVAQVKEAIQYVQGKIDALPVGAMSTTALPAASTTAEVEEHLAVIRAYTREIMERERSLYFALRDVLPPLRGMTRPLSLRLHKSMDSGFEVLDVALKQVESTARLVLAYARG